VTPFLARGATVPLFTPAASASVYSYPFLLAEPRSWDPFNRSSPSAAVASTAATSAAGSPTAGPCPVINLALNLMALVTEVAPVCRTTAMINKMTVSTRNVWDPSMMMATRPSAYGGEHTMAPMAPPTVVAVSLSRRVPS
jgi:hypothetical protein